MAEVHVVGSAQEIELIARRLGTRLHLERDGDITFGAFDVDAPKVICLDTETTGLDPVEDEILTLSIVDWDGNTLLDGHYKPDLKTEWPEAERINGINPADCAGLPSIYDDQEKIREILESADEIIAYNASFDLRFLAYNDMEPRSDTKITDTMLEYAELIGEWDNYHEGWKWHKLTAAAAHIGYEWTGKAHGSMADTLACLAVQKWIEEQKFI